MKSFFRLMLLGLVLVFVALASALTAMRYAIHGREVAVPKLVGLTPAQAQKALAAKGLVLDTERRFYSREIPEGRIMSQVPEAGILVRRGWRVRVAESLGPQRVTIPDILGQSSRAAEINIRRWGLELGTVATVDIPDLPPNQVVAQSPPPSAESVASPKISLLETAPPQPATFIMPDFVGQSLTVAREEVSDAGLIVGNVMLFAPAPMNPPTPAPAAPNAPASAPATAPQPGPSAPPQSPAKAPEFSPGALIVGQNPAAGQKVTAGTVVSFQVHQ
jgi:eukaryotic-like serine/threonine-protein kinase